MKQSIILTILWQLALMLPSNPAISGPASKVVERLNTTLLDVMKNADSLGYKGRFDRLFDVIAATHDLEYIAQFAIGKRNWGSLNERQKYTFLTTFRTYSVAIYANRFNGYSGESFYVFREQPGKRNQIQVNSTLTIPGEKNVNFVYMLKTNGDTLKIVNIIVDGVSDLALKRSEFMTILNELGYDALQKHLIDKTNQLTAD